MRLFLFGFICLFCGAAIADSSVPSIVYVSNASNLTTGTVSVERLPVGDKAATVASGADKRFDTVSVGKPAESAPDGRALVWIEM